VEREGPARCLTVPGRLFILEKLLTDMMLISVSTTTMLAIGVTTGTAILSVVLIGLLTVKELSVTYPSVDHRVKDSLNAALLPILFAFAMLVVVQVL